MSCRTNIYGKRRGPGRYWHKEEQELEQTLAEGDELMEALMNACAPEAEVNQMELLPRGA